MKKLLVFCSCCCFSLAVGAQHETLFSNTKVVGGFGAPIVEMGLSKHLNTSYGGGGGIVINNFFIGGYGLGAINLQELIENEELKEMQIGHGGLWLGSTWHPYRVMHFYGSARVGWGVVDARFDQGNVILNEMDRIFVLTPELGLELNVTKWFRVAATAGYRWVSGTNQLRGYTDENFSGGVATLAFRLGWFGWRRE